MAETQEMTARRWDVCREPDKMLGFLGDRASARKLRLFGCACCRRVPDLLDDARRRQALEVAERFADGRARARQLRAAQRVMEETRGPGYGPNAARAAWYCCRPWLDAGSIHRNISLGIAHGKRRSAEVAAQAALLREVFGNPLRPVALDPAWLAWRGGTVPNLARAICEDGAFDRLPILADALEEAGCADADILEHCRAPRPHVRGCHVLDAIMGR